MKKTGIIFGLFLILTLTLAASVAAQKRPAKPKPKSTSGTKSASMKNADIQQGAERLGNQIKNLSKFLYLLGGTAKGIEAVDFAVLRGDASRPTIEQNNKNKGTIVLAIRNFRQGFDDLEAVFRFNPNLKNYYPHILGVAEKAALAEAEADNGKFDTAGRNLLEVLNRLTDALLKMR